MQPADDAGKGKYLFTYGYSKCSVYSSFSRDFFSLQYLVKTNDAQQKNFAFYFVSARH
jgi:hypothetical protein